MVDMNEKDIISGFEKIAQYKPGEDSAGRDLQKVRDMLTSQRGRIAPKRESIWRIIMKSNMTKFGTAAAIIFAVIIVMNGLNGTPAWADVVSAFNKAMSIHIVKTDTLTDDGIMRRSESWIKNQTLFRAQSHNWCVVDNGREVLTLYEGNRIAHLRASSTPYWDYTPLILKVFRDGKDENDITIAMLPEESDQDIHVYEIVFRDYWQGKVWVDTASNLPVHITGYENGGKEREFEITFDYEPIADEVFSTAIPSGFRELPSVTNSIYRQENQVLFGTVVDEQGNPVADALVYASYADPGKTDEDGKFSLPVPKRDGSNSIGSPDFPMFVRAFNKNDPYSVAWTIIRYPHRSESKEYPLIEKTHQGVELVIENEDELAKILAGESGQFSVNPDEDPIVKDIVLAMGPGGSITGHVTNLSDEPIANATVWIEELEIELPTAGKVTISNLGSEWQGKVFAVTDNDGFYELTNLPVPLNKIELRVKADGYDIAQQEFEGDGGDLVEGCNLQLIKRAQVTSARIEPYFGSIYKSRDIEESKHFSEVQANGYPIKGSGNSIESAVPAGLHENLVLYYSFDANDEPDVAADISGNGFDGRINGANYVNDEILGKAMSFGANDSYISLPDLYLAGFTFSAWVKTKTLDLNNRRIFLLDDGENVYTLEGNSRDGVSTYVTDIEISEYDWQLQLDQWTHLTVTYDGEKTVNIYKNGRLTEMATGAFSTEGIEGKAYIGFSGDTGEDRRHDGDNCWHGMIDEVAIFNRSLTEEEVEQLFGMTGQIEEEQYDENTTDLNTTEITPGTSERTHYYGEPRRPRTRTFKTTSVSR